MKTYIISKKKIKKNELKTLNKFQMHFEGKDDDFWPKKWW
jgi:hypothetical protein